MKIRIPLCSTCKYAGFGLKENFVQVEESGQYEYTCANGHTSHFIIRNLKHELLFDSGILSTKEGYYREGVVNFAASLERFLEFYIYVLIRYKNADFNAEELKAVWKSMHNSSEQQKGAFWILYYAVFNQAPPAFDSKFLSERSITLGSKYKDPVNFRNAVTHQGIFPTYQQAASYGEAVRAYIVHLFELSGQHLNDFQLIVIKTTNGPPFKSHPFHADRTSFRGDELVALNASTFLNTGPMMMLDAKRSLFELLPLES